MNEHGLDSSQNLEGDTQYKAPYYEFTVEEFTTDIVRSFRKLVPDGIDVGNGQEPEKIEIRVRRISLPEDSNLRKARVDEIATAGTDRTDPTITSKYNTNYLRAAAEFNVDPMDIIDAGSPMTLYDHPEFLKQNPDNTSHHTSSNGLLIYDVKTEKGLKHLRGPEYTFKDLNRKNEALLAIVYLK